MPETLSPWGCFSLILELEKLSVVRSRLVGFWFGWVVEVVEVSILGVTIMRLVNKKGVFSGYFMQRKKHKFYSIRKF